LVPVQYVGIGTIISATLLLTISRVDERLQIRETAKYGAVFAAVVAGIDLAAKYLVTGASPLAIYALAGLGQGIAGGIGLLYLGLYRRSRIAGNMGMAGLRAIGVRTVLFVTGLTLFYLALVSTPVSIASSIVATQTAFTVFFTWIAVRFGFGGVEELGEVSHAVKLVAAIGIIAGVTLLSRPSLLPF
ncbi:MAG: hypothetical protein SVU32_02210, partial [Candidatus Nanohaloarchaea archaeon]|nr:hypothetical protein [Candidatus Nanohaloarchaea archaeon]